MGFVYTPPSDTLIQDRKSPPSNFDNILKESYRRYKLKLKARPDAYKIRILPASWQGMPQFAGVPLAWAIKFGIHYHIGADNGAYVCNLSLNHQPTCSLCNIQSEFARKGDKASSDLIRAQTRAMAWVIDRENEVKGPQLFEFPATLEQNIWNVSLDKETRKMRYVDDPIGGHNLFLTRVGDDQKTRWFPEVAPSATPLSNNPEQAAAWLQFVFENPLPGVLNFYPDEYISEIFAGTRKQGTLSQFHQTDGQHVSPSPVADTATPQLVGSAVATSNEPVVQEAGFRRPMR
jgi:hypothetical protein